MTLHPTPTDPIPENTARAARSASRQDNPYVLMRERFGTIFCDLDFAALYPPQGQPGYAPWRLALVTLVQYIEHLSDEAVADQVALRLDLKYLLGLELGAPRFDPSILSEFRTRLVKQEATTLLFDRLLARLHHEGLALPGGKARTDSTTVVAAVRQLNLLALVRETLRSALTTLAVVDPAWLRAQGDPAWVQRYARRSENERLPQQATKRRALERTIGEDGSRLLTALHAADAPAYLREVPAVQLLRTVWLQRYYQDQRGIRLRRRDKEGMPPCSQAIASPYDPDARWSVKRGEEWIGYKTHLTEACDPEAPHLLLGDWTTDATVPDGEALPHLQQDLVGKDLPPDEQVVDAGYGDADNVVASRSRGIKLLGPLPRDTSWQARTEGAFDLSHFEIDWDQHTVRCPGGQESVRWTAKPNQRGTEVIVVLFDRAGCQACPLRSQCTRSERRQLMLRPKEQHEVLQAARAHQETEAFKQEYAIRAGVEGTISQGTRRCGMDQCRYRGAGKTRFQEAATGAALNYLRVAAHLAGHKLARTRRSALERVFDQAA
jgi:transposase